MRWTLLDGLDDGDRREVLAATHRCRFARGEVLFREGEVANALHLIDKGTVGARVATSTGDSVTVQVLGRGEVVGEMALVAEPLVRSATVFAFEVTETLALPREELDRLRMRHSSVDRVLVEILAVKLAHLSRLMAEARSVPAEQRVLRRLLDLLLVFATDEIAPVVPVSQDDLAGLAGTTRETVNRALRAAERDRLVTLGRNRVTIIDLDGLTRRSGSVS